MKTKSTRTLLKVLAPGSFFKFDKDGDIICRLVEFRNGKVYFHAIGETGIEDLRQDIDESRVYIVTQVPTIYQETLKTEFLEVMKNNIQRHLNAWEICLFKFVTVSDINFSDLKGQYNDNPKLMTEMLGYPAVTILSNL